MSGVILTCNAGSTNTKLAIFDAKKLECLGHTKTHNDAEIMAWVCSVSQPILAVGHRVVHGGISFTEPTLLTAETIAVLEKLVLLAPLHQPAALKLIAEMQRLYPAVPHIACFDTAFHHSMGELETRLPLPRSYHEEGVRRYGFHGLSYQHIASQLPKSRVIAAHLGGGSSACAMKDGKSVASTMGFSTLDGMMMSTRPGALDAGVMLYLLEEKQMTPKAISELLYHESGLKGISGISGDMQELVLKGAQEAIALYCYLAAKQIASLLPALGGIDTLVFTGGIGEHAAPVREKIVSHLGWLGDIPVQVITANEEAVIAVACQAQCK